MNSDPSVSSVAALDRFLKRGRRRLRASRFAKVWYSILVAVIGVAAALVIVGLLGIVPWPERGAWFAIVMAAAAASATVAAVLALSEPLDLRRVARIADSQLGLGSLLTASLEVQTANGPKSLAEEALLHVLAERMGALDPVTLADTTWQRRHVVLGLAALLIAVAGVLPPAAAISSETHAVATTSIRAASNLNRLAAALEGDDEAPADLLAPMTAAMRELARRAESGELTERELSAQIATLLETLAASAESSHPELSQLVSDALMEVGPSSEQTTPGRGVEPFRFGSETSSDLAEESGINAATAARISDRFDPSEVFRTLGEVASSLEERAARALSANAESDMGAGPTDGGAAPSSVYYTEWEEVMGEEFRARQAALRQHGVGEMAVGEAQQSDDTPGDAPGRGTQPLEEGAAAQGTDLLQAASQTVALSAQGREDGRLVTQMPEPLEGVRGTPWDPEGLTASLIQAEEGPMTIEHIGVEEAALIAKYFSRQSRTSASAEGE